MLTPTEETADYRGLRLPLGLDPGAHDAEVLRVAAEIADELVPASDDELGAWGFVRTWRERLQERGIRVPPPLEKVFRRLEKRAAAGEQTAHTFPDLLEDVPPELRPQAYALVIEGYESIFRERGMIVPIWVGIARARLLSQETATDEAGG